MKILKPIFKISILALVGVSMFIWLLSWVSPEQFPLAGVAYLAFPYLGFLSLAVLLALLYFFPRRKLIILVLIGIFSYQLSSFTGLRPGSIFSIDCSDHKISLLSYNVNNFGLFEWKDREGVRDSIMELVSSLNPDVVCFQDFFTRHEQENLDNIFFMKEELGYDYHFFSPTLTNRLGHQWGLAVFSKFPITDTSFIDFSDYDKGANTNGVQLVHIEKNEKPFLLLNYHLESYHLGRHYNLEKAEKTYSFKWWYKNLPGVVRFMLPSMKNKTRQANIISEIIEDSAIPVIAAGDMNNIAGSYIYRRIHSQLKDTAYGSKKAVPVTLNGFPPLFRIDYISVSPHWETCHFEIPQLVFSNHYPVFVKVSLEQ